MTDKIEAPFTPEQVRHLNAWQHGPYHPFTCGSGDRMDARHVAYQAEHPDEDFGQLIATAEGWICPVCSYRQQWAHGFMGEAFR